MKIHALYDKSGRILAAVNLDGEAKSPATPRVRPVPKKKGHKAADFDVPVEHSHGEFLEVVSRLRVDTKGKTHTLIAQEKKSKKSKM
jgi:hypothetical protein